MSDWIGQNFGTGQAEFGVLCETLQLEDLHVLEGISISAAAGYIRVYLENDRGLCDMAIGPRDDPRPFGSVGEIAERYPRIRGGFQRLTFEEQRSFLTRNWTELQTMFSPEHLQNTRKWRQAVAADLGKKYSRKG